MDKHNIKPRVDKESTEEQHIDAGKQTNQDER
jgi:hypothetical protein